MSNSFSSRHRFRKKETARVAREREAAYAAVPGLIQKYYLRLNKPNFYGGIMIWESREAMQAFRETDLAKSVPAVYEVIGAPDVDIHEMLFPLRNCVEYVSETVAV